MTAYVKLVECIGFEKDTTPLKIKFQGKKCKVLRDDVPSKHCC